MIKAFALGIILFPLLSWGETLEKPLRCMKKEVYPCAVWTFHKKHFPMAGVQVFVSADTLFEIRENSIYHIRGRLWVVSDKALKIENRFGSVKFEGRGEVWSEATSEEFVVRAFSNELLVLPRGGTQDVPLSSGFEMKLSYVNRETGLADVSGPSLIALASQLKSLHSVLDSEDLFKEKADRLAAVILAAAPKAAALSRLGLERQAASVASASVSEQEREVRLKYEKKKNEGRDSYLRKLFIQKSNFED